MTDVPAPSDLMGDQITPEAATTRIAELKADPVFREKYLNGEAGARGEFARLHSVVGKGAVDETAVHRASQLDTLKKYASLPNECWDQVAKNGPVHQHERDEALRRKEICKRDRAWVARYLDGSTEEVSLMTRINLILSSPVHKQGT